MRKGSSRRPSLISLIVFITGIVGAYAAGVATYREVGLYGGPVASGFFREWDAAQGRYVLAHYQTDQSGSRIRRVFRDDLGLQLTEINAGDVKVSVEVKPDTPLGFDRVGFSVLNDGVIDAWMTHDTKTGLNKVEISTKRNGKIDRWEYYRVSRLLRVELDTNGNGKPDRWMTYEDGIQMETVLDVNEDGQPDGR